MPQVSAFNCLFKGITTNTNSLAGRLAFFHSNGLLSKLFVGGLSLHTNEQVLRDAFSLYGQVLEASVIVDRDNGQSKGFGFVQFASKMEADNALEEMNGRFLDGRNIHVDIAYLRLHYNGDLPRAVGPPPGVKPKRLQLNEEIYTRRRIKRS